MIQALPLLVVLGLAPQGARMRPACGATFGTEGCRSRPGPEAVSAAPAAARKPSSPRSSRRRST